MKAYHLTKWVLIMQGQMSIFDFLSEEKTETKFPSVINGLSRDLNDLLYPHKAEEKYSIWEHVSNLGYRYEMWVTVNDIELDFIIDKLNKISEKYMSKSLEVSVNIIPDVSKQGSTRLFISTLWKDKIRAKNG